MADLTALYREDATEEETVEAYQDMIDSGHVWSMEGHVGRTAMSLIESGRCTLGPEPSKDYWGNRIPSKSEVKPGTMGSPEYVEAQR
jgi:hypothetical protein